MLRKNKANSQEADEKDKAPSHKKNPTSFFDIFDKLKTKQKHKRNPAELFTTPVKPRFDAEDKNPTNQLNRLLKEYITEYCSGQATGRNINPLSQIDTNENLKAYDTNGLVYDMCSLAYASIPPGELTDFVQRYISAAVQNGTIQTTQAGKENIKEIYTAFINYFGQFTNKKYLEKAVFDIKNRLKKIDTFDAMEAVIYDIQKHEPLAFKSNPLESQDDDFAESKKACSNSMGSLSFLSTSSSPSENSDEMVVGEISLEELEKKRIDYTRHPPVSIKKR